jgi:trigger factor
MTHSVRTTGTWQRTLDVEVPADEVEGHLEDVARGIQRRASRPGFRKGHMPLDMIRQQFADSVEQEFLETFVPRFANQAIQEAELNPVVPPLVRNLQFSPGQPMKFEAVVDVRPEVEAKDYRGLPVSRRQKAITDDDVARVLAELREDSAVFVDLDRPAERGDVVLLDSTRLDANGRRLPGTRAKGRRIGLGAPDVLPDLENALLGSQSGQERTFELHYPAEYPVTELAGQTARYVVNVKKIQEKKLRDLDDNLARDVFKLESLEALKARIRENLEGEEQTRVRRELEGVVAGELIRRNPVELPERMVQWMLDRVIQDATEGRAVGDELRKEMEQRYRAGVERSLQREILLDAVARQEKLSVTDDDVAAEIQRMAQADPRQASRVRARYQTAERRQALKESLLERKALDWLIDAADVRDESAAESSLIIPATR